MDHDPYDCVLTLALPQALEEEVLDVLLAHPEWVDGFSVVQAEGHGRGTRAEPLTPVSVAPTIQRH